MRYFLFKWVFLELNRLTMIKGKLRTSLLIDIIIMYYKIPYAMSVSVLVQGLFDPLVLFL